MAQSIHIGKSADSPRQSPLSVSIQKKFETITLNGSFRLPFRISECLKPISINIKKEYEDRGRAVAIIEPYKGAPPGARPIIVFGQTSEKAAHKIKEIFECYQIFGFNSITIFEKDVDLKNSLSTVGISAETETTLRMKGLEKPCVLWSARVNIDTEDEIEEFVYTILTRTSSVLIIAIIENIQAKYIPIFKALIKERFIIWDAESNDKFIEICKSCSEATDQGDSEEEE